MKHTKWVTSPMIKRLSCLLFSCILLPSVYAENYPATLQWARRVELSLPVSGVIKHVAVEVGERVAKGTVLVQLDDEVFKSSLNSTQATLRYQEEQYKEVQKELQRAQELYDRTLLSDHDLQVAKNNESQAKSELEKTRTALIRAKYALNYSVLRAPFNAWILSRSADPGNVISAELKPETLIVAAAADQMQARIWISDTKLAKLQKGMSAKVRVNDQEINGTVKSIALEPEQKSSEGVRYAVDIEFPSTNLTLRAGQQASVNLP